MDHSKAMRISRLLILILQMLWLPSLDIQDDSIPNLNFHSNVGNYIFMPTITISGLFAFEDNLIHFHEKAVLSSRNNEASV